MKHERYAVDVRNAKWALRCQHVAIRDSDRLPAQCQYLFGHDGQCWNGEYHFSPHKSCI
jgi:hypothetical protein